MPLIWTFLQCSQSKKLLGKHKLCTRMERCDSQRKSFI